MSCSRRIHVLEEQVPVRGLQYCTACGRSTSLSDYEVPMFLRSGSVLNSSSLSFTLGDRQNCSADLLVGRILSVVPVHNQILSSLAGRVSHLCAHHPHHTHSIADSLCPSTRTRSDIFWMSFETESWIGEMGTSKCLLKSLLCFLGACPRDISSGGARIGVMKASRASTRPILQ